MTLGVLAVGVVPGILVGAAFAAGIDQPHLPSAGCGPARGAGARIHDLVDAPKGIPSPG